MLAHGVADVGRRGVDARRTEPFGQRAAPCVRLGNQQQAQQALGQQLQAQQQSIAGVDPNEELIQMLNFQRSFQAAARYLSAVNDTLNDLFQTL